MTKIIITGKSWSWKTTLSDHLEETYSYSIPYNYTTRKPREYNKKDFSEYLFVSRLYFEHLRDSGQLLNWTEFNWNYYWTGAQLYWEDNVFVVDDNWRQDLLNIFPDAITVWVEVDSFTRRKRLFDRGLRGEDLEARMEGASEQMKATDSCYIIDWTAPVEESAKTLIELINEKQWAWKN